MSWSKLLLVALAACLSLPCIAADWPTRPVTLVVGYAPGGGTDIFARLTAAKLSETLGQPVIIENKPGANAAIAGGQVAQAAPDGYTLLFAVTSHYTNPGNIANMGYDPVTGFKVIGLVAGAPDVLAVRQDLPVKSLGELIALAKSQPGTLIAASPGLGSPADLVFHLLESSGGFRTKSVQYRGSLPAITDVIAGQDDLLMSNIAETMPFASSGKLRLVAQTGKTRSLQAQDVPTIAESGVPGLQGFSAMTWFAILAPARTPPVIIARLNAALNDVSQRADLRAQFRDIGGEPLTGTPEAAERFVMAEQARWLQVMKDIGIAPK